MVIVVEGKNDKNKLENIFHEAFIITTNGSEISVDTLKTIKELSVNNEVVLCLDPDGPGERIRKKVMEYVPTCSNVYAIKSKAISKNKRKVGIEHMSKEDILDMFSNIHKSVNTGNITFYELYELGLASSRSKRALLCDRLNISYCNAKQLLKRLNAMGIDIEKVKENI